MTNAPDPSAIGLNPDRLEQAYAFLDQSVATGKLPGAVLLVARRGVALEPRPFGRLRLETPSPPVQANTIFLVASVTKPVVVSAVMLLVERGEVLLNDPVSRYVPEFGNQDKKAVTLHHLMTHTSGLPDMLPENEQLRRDHAPLAEFVRRICDLPLGFEPGTSIQYQSTGIAMLGEIVQRVSGLSIRDFLRREIFDPLAMTDTALGAAGLDASRIAQIDVGSEMAEQDWNWNRPYWQNFGAPWGGMLTTAGDLFRYLQLYLDGGQRNDVQIFSPATIQAMIRDQTSHMPRIPAATKSGNSWGLGWRLFPTSRWSYFGDLLAPGAFGHGGATGTVVWIDPARDVICILFTTKPSKHSETLLGRCSNLVAASIEGGS